MRESTIEGRLVRAAAKAGWWAPKFVSPGCAGVPDRILLGPEGRIAFVELKTESGRLTAMQRRQIDRLRGLGHEVWVLYGREDVDAFIREVINREVHPARLPDQGD